MRSTHPGPAQPPVWLLAFLAIALLPVTAGLPALASPSTEGPAPALLEVEVLDVGQGDGLVLHLPTGVVVVDTGRDGQAVTEHLEAEGVTTLTALVVTHPDADHAGGCAKIFARFDVLTFYHPGTSKDTATWRACQDAAAAETGLPGDGVTGVDRTFTDEELDPGVYLPLDPIVRAHLLHLGGAWEDVNDQSIVLRLDAGEVSALLTGDISCDVEDVLILRSQAAFRPTYTLEAAFLKVAHHGSATSTCDPWLEASTPELAVISAGQGNPFGHPHQVVLDRLAAHDVQVLRTDVHGTVTWSTDGVAWWVDR